MPKLNNFKVKIETGDQGTPGPVQFCINSHTLPFENPTGETGAGCVFEGGFEVNSFAHSLTLVGPEEGQWHIKKVQVDFNCESVEPYSVTYVDVTLDDSSQLDIWQDPPLPTFDV
jgi:hypothetical protein